MVENNFLKKLVGQKIYVVFGIVRQNSYVTAHSWPKSDTSTIDSTQDKGVYKLVKIEKDGIVLEKYASCYLDRDELKKEINKIKKKYGKSTKITYKISKYQTGSCKLLFTVPFFAPFNCIKTIERADDDDAIEGAS